MSGAATNPLARPQRPRADAAASGRPFLLVLFGVFVAVMLAALLTGLQAYRVMVDERNGTDEQRLAYGSLVNAVKAFDSADALSVSEYDGNDVLSMEQRTADARYLMRLYVHEGTLMQQFSLADAPLAPESAHALFATDVFSVDYDDGLLVLTTDGARPTVRLACPQPTLEETLGRSGRATTEAGDA